MPRAFLTRRETFSAAHRLHSSALTNEENERIYGKCNWVAGHGHNYTLYVTVQGEIDSMTGMVMNLTDLKSMMQKVVSRLDHKFIDKNIKHFESVPSTVENIAVFIWDTLVEETFPTNVALYEMKLYETENNVAIYRGQ